MKVKCLLIGVLVLFVTGMLTTSSYAKLDPKTILGMWLFDEGSGNVAKDSSGNKNDGKFISTPQWAAGKFGKGLMFDGATTYLNCGNSDTLRITGQTVTVAAWIKTNNNCNQGGIIVRGNPAAPWDGYSMSVGGNLTNGQLGFWYGNGSNWDFSVSLVNDNNWHHVATVFDSTQTKFYIDGKLDATVKITGKVSLDCVGQPTGIGSDQGPSRFYNGTLDELAVFNIMVEEADINNIMSKGLLSLLAVNLSGKLSATWADIKTQ
jgi:hypothetical protein